MRCTPRSSFALAHCIALPTRRLAHPSLGPAAPPAASQNVVQADALCTLSAIEEANTRVEELLSEESRERHSVSGGWALVPWVEWPGGGISAWLEQAQ